MINWNQPTFPNNSVCENCIARPCKRLFSGRVYPGKMLFLHRREFLSLPCYRPHFAMEDNDGTEAAALTDDLEVTSGEISVTNPRWEHVDEDKKSTTPDIAMVGDEVYLYVDVSGVPEGATVTFDVFDVSSDPPFRIGSASGKNQQGTAQGKWMVDDPSEKGDELKVEFEGIAKSRASERREIPLSMVFVIHLQIDVDDPKAKDDELILVDDSGAEVMKLCVGDMKEVSEDMIRLEFPDLEMDKKYTFYRDYGPDEDGGQDPLFVDLSPNEIRQLFEE
jgi:hypothetical protein